MSSSADSEGRTLNGRALVAGLQAAIRALPSSREKQELRQSIDDLIRFLTDLRDSLDLIPTLDDASKADRAVEALAGLFEKAESSPALAAALGISSRRESARPRSRPPEGAPATERVDPSRVDGLLQRLRQQPVESIRRELEDPERHSTGILRAVAAQLGIKGAAKLSRETMAHQISMKIANYRGYQRLRGEENPGSDGA